MAKKLGFQIGGVVVCDVEVQSNGLVLLAYKNDVLIGKVSAWLGSNNQPTGQWSYELNDAKSEKHVGSHNFYAGYNYKDAMIKMLKRAKLV